MTSTSQESAGRLIRLTAPKAVQGGRKPTQETRRRRALDLLEQRRRASVSHNLRMRGICLPEAELTLSAVRTCFLCSAIHTCTAQGWAGWTMDTRKVASINASPTQS